MALPRFETPSDLESQGGLIAVNFTLRSDYPIYKPTILDAILSPYFMPAPRVLGHGLTYPMTGCRTMNDPGQLGQGNVEFICQPMSVPVKVGTVVNMEEVGYFS